jgi:predicted nucleic acid-binding Zn ribbon protein
MDGTVHRNTTTIAPIQMPREELLESWEAASKRRRKTMVILACVLALAVAVAIGLLVVFV